jgi:copper chaperone NosL
MKNGLIIAIATLVACGNRPLRPIDVDATDMCARCRMAISQSRYAAELIDRDGDVRKFDDIGCMVRYTQDNHLDPRQQNYFVMDYGSRHWLEAARAFYVRSEAIPSPMSGGIVAFPDRSQASQFARGIDGALMTFEELWTSKS